MGEPQDKIIRVEPTADGLVPSQGQGLSLHRDHYAGASKLKFTPKEVNLMRAEFKDEEHSILPTGEIYAAQNCYRRRLLDVFGPGQWALVPKFAEGTFSYDKENNAVTTIQILYIRGKYAAEAMGAGNYSPKNPRQNYADACEAAKSIALVRCCKDIGIGAECWDKKFIREFKAKHCGAFRVQLMYKNEESTLWRRLDEPPFGPYGMPPCKSEIGRVDNQPALKGAHGDSVGAAARGISDADRNFLKGVMATKYPKLDEKERNKKIAEAAYGVCRVKDPNQLTAAQVQEIVKAIREEE